MAKKIELKEQNRSTWNTKTVPENSHELIERIKAKVESEKEVEDGADEIAEGGDIAILNNTGLKSITAVLSMKESIVDTMVVSPSGIIYGFKVDLASDDLDFEWWLFAMKNYHMVLSTTNVKKKLVEFFGIENKEMKAKIVFKGKNVDENDDMELKDLIDTYYPKLEKSLKIK